MDLIRCVSKARVSSSGRPASWLHFSLLFQAAVKEVANLSLVSSASEVVSAACDSSKESQPCLSSVCDAAEKGVQSVTQATASCVQPTLANLEPYVSEHAAKGLEKLGEELPLVPKLVEQVRVKGCAVPGRQRGLVLVGFLS
uniref:Uncharacterized protein n=1 Tax=Zonotrichia albicollis TaxID=44394 RepID=A0A8D2NGE8_ZONAL